MKLTKKAVIARLIESAAAMTEAGRKDFEETVLPVWTAMGAEEAIAEANSVFGWDAVDENGQAYASA